VTDNVVRILDGNTFVVSSDSGDIEASPATATGFFSFDTRFLSLWRLSINGERLHPLAIDDARYFQMRFFLVPGVPTQYLDAKVSVVRERSIVDGFEERLTVLNHAGEPADMTVRIDVDADFRPLTGIAQHTPQVGRLYKHAEHGSLRLGYAGEVPPRDDHHQHRAGGRRPKRAHLHDPHRPAQPMDHDTEHLSARVAPGRGRRP
jgi:hypothetical protein